MLNYRMCIQDNINNECHIKSYFSQLVENYRTGSAEGLSLNFLSIWLAGK